MRRVRRPAGPGPEAVNIAAGGERAKQITVRFFCQGIGDCHLLRFRKDDGSDFWMMIDCGVHSSIKGGAETIDAIVDNIATLTDKKLDVIVLTHEHWDHNSAFKTAQSKFKDFRVGEVWMGWTENPNDKQAVEFDKFKETAADALHGAHQKFNRLKAANELTPHLAAIKVGLDHLLGFTLGVKGQRVRDARKAVEGLPKSGKPRYLEPSTPPFLMPGVAGIRVYVLGPPRDTKLFGITERPSEMYGIGSQDTSAMVRALADPLKIAKGDPDWWDDFASPFDANEGFLLSKLTKKKRNKTGGGREVSKKNGRPEDKNGRKEVAQFLRKSYLGPATSTVSAGWRTKRMPGGKLPTRRVGQSWRRIDNDWLGASADLGIQLDQRTNNSSLVLAFEFIDSGHVMLFVGDAQVGNWMSWEKVSWTVDKKTVTAHELLAQTVFYKVGHHGSQNATLKQNGLELMVHPDLSAFIPTNSDDAQNVHWGAMPFEKLTDALKKRTHERVVRADDKWVKNKGAQPDGLKSGAIKRICHDTENGLWVEMDIG